MVTIVVLNYNGITLLSKFLPSLLRYSGHYPIVVVDNASVDGSVAFIKKHFPTVSCLVHAENYGFAKGYNIALKQLQTTYYLLLNNDIMVTNGWLSNMLNLMELNPSIAFCQPKIRSLIRPDQFDYAGAAGGFIDVDGYPFCRGRIFDAIEKDYGQYDDTRSVFWASGACFMVRAEAFHELGGFDELFFSHFEEIDLCWRAQLAGWQVYYCGASSVYHLGGATIAYGSSQKSYLNYRNRALMLYKYDSALRIVRRLVLDLLAALRLCCLGRMASSWAVVRAQVDFFKLRKKCLINRSNIVLPNRYSGSLIVDFFIKHKKVFAKLSPKRFG